MRCCGGHPHPHQLSWHPNRAPTASAADAAAAANAAGEQLTEVRGHWSVVSKTGRSSPAASTTSSWCERLVLPGNGLCSFHAQSLITDTACQPPAAMQRCKLASTSSTTPGRACMQPHQQLSHCLTASTALMMAAHAARASTAGPVPRLSVNFQGECRCSAIARSRICIVACSMSSRARARSSTALACSASCAMAEDSSQASRSPCSSSSSSTGRASKWYCTVTGADFQRG